MGAEEARQMKIEEQARRLGREATFSLNAAQNSHGCRAELRVGHGWGR